MSDRCDPRHLMYAVFVRLLFHQTDNTVVTFQGGYLAKCDVLSITLLVQSMPATMPVRIIITEAEENGEIFSVNVVI